MLLGISLSLLTPYFSSFSQPVHADPLPLTHTKSSCYESSTCSISDPPHLLAASLLKVAHHF